MRELILDGIFQLDVAEAAAWYKERSEESSAKFLDSIEHTLNFIEVNPFLYVTNGRGLRKAKISNFPYCIYYYILESEIIAIACLHTSRDLDSILEERM